ncbi:MAG: hypothetical protein ABI091_24900, partial [Ferruginibacter sp.]
MKQLFIFFITILFIGNAYSQCLSGDCKNGKGKYDFGWCIYEGDFKNEKPDGSGTMKYDDYSYTGGFKNGVEDGDGVITYKNGKSEQVKYYEGKKIDFKPIPLKEGEYKELEGYDLNCKGNCHTGYGTYSFPSGNTYKGNFVNMKRQGHGTFYYASGSIFEGEWNDNKMVSGTFTYNTGATYVGTYDDAGNELNGTVIAGSRRISIFNGKAIIPKQELYGYDTRTPEQIEKEKER